MNLQELKVLSEKVLSDCKPSDAFWTCHGRIVRNIYELANTIESMDDSSFIYHVNDDHNKNDFAKWIKEVLDDSELARRLENVRYKKTYIEIIRDRIKELESAA